MIGLGSDKNMVEGFSYEKPQNDIWWRISSHAMSSQPRILQMQVFRSVVGHWSVLLLFMCSHNILYCDVNLTVVLFPQIMQPKILTISAFWLNKWVQGCVDIISTIYTQDVKKFAPCACDVNENIVPVNQWILFSVMSNVEINCW